MANKKREEIQKRAQKAIIQESFFRTESAIVIALTIVLTGLSAAIRGLGVDTVPLIGAVHPLLWLLGGSLIEAGIVYSSMTDPEFGRKVVARLLENEFTPARLRDKRLQQQIQEALDYRARIERAAQEQGDDSIMGDELNQTASQIDEWLENMYDLAQRIDRYQQDREVLERDRKRAETRLQQLGEQLKHTDNPAVQNQLQTTTESIERQLTTLETLNDTIQRARLQLENSLIHLGTIYSQTMLVDAKDIDKSRARRLRQEISDEVTELNDLLLAMDDVYSAETAV